MCVAFTVYFRRECFPYLSMSFLEIARSNNIRYLRAPNATYFRSAVDGVFTVSISRLQGYTNLSASCAFLKSQSLPNLNPVRRHYLLSRMMNHSVRGDQINVQPPPQPSEYTRNIETVSVPRKYLVLVEMSGLMWL